MSAPVVSFNPIMNSMNDTENSMKNTFKDCYNTVVNALMHSEDVHADALKLKACMNELAETQKEMAALVIATAEIKSTFEKSNLNGGTAVQLFDDIFLQHLQNADIDENQKECISSVQNLIEDRQASEDNYEDSDELCVTKETQSFKDPLTQRVIENPVKSKVCNHVFESSSITKYLEHSSRKCPYSGCRSLLRRDDIVLDLQLKMTLSKKQQEENSD